MRSLDTWAASKHPRVSVVEVICSLGEAVKLHSILFLNLPPFVKNPRKRKRVEVFDLRRKRIE